MAALYERLGQPTDADRILKRLQTVKGQEVTVCLLQARFCISRKQYERARKVLTAGLETLPKRAIPALRHELIRLDLAEGKIDGAREELLKAVKADPTNLDSLVQLADLAVQAGDLAEVKQRETELHKLEGDDGLFWRYYRALRLLAEATGPDDDKLAEASKLQASVQTQRPTWSKAYVLEGVLLDARGDFDQAADAYKEAIRLGERLPLVFQRLISRLLQTNQADEADRYLAIMQNGASTPLRYASLDSAVAANRGQMDRALESARHAVEQRPKDPLSQLWLGRLLSSANKTSEAETVLKKAAALAPNDPRAVAGLFDFYLRAKRPAEAREVLQQIAKNRKFDKVQQASMLAQGYEALGDKEQAIANYRKAAQLDAGNSAAQVRLAEYLLRAGTTADRSEAEQLLRDVLRKSPDSAVCARARQSLAMLLAERGGAEAWQEAYRLVDDVGKNRSLSNVDKRLQAILLWHRGGKENLDKARRVLEDLVADPKKASDADRRRLARFYEASGNVGAARQQYLKLVNGKQVDQADRGAYVELLLQNGSLDEADAELKKWEADQPGDLAAAALRARWLRGKGQTDKIEPLIEPLAGKAVKQLPKDSPEEAKFLFNMGKFYSALDQHQAAERWYRRLMVLRPKAYQPLAGSLARQGRMKEAIELCREAAKSDSSAMPAIATAMTLLAGKPSADDFALAEPLLSKAAADHKDNADLLGALANVRVVQQRIEEAIALFRRVLVVRPDDVMTLNSLATLLGERPDNREEALRDIDRAIEISGQRPEFLDTKGMILVLNGKPADAVPLLQQAAASPTADPRNYFHLAVAYDRVRQPEKARAAFPPHAKTI